jgi:hypothetical protein
LSPGARSQIGHEPVYFTLAPQQAAAQPDRRGQSAGCHIDVNCTPRTVSKLCAQFGEIQVSVRHSFRSFQVSVIRIMPENVPWEQIVVTTPEKCLH